MSTNIAENEAGQQPGSPTEGVSEDLLGNSPDAKRFAKRKLVLMEYMQKVKDTEFHIEP